MRMIECSFVYLGHILSVNLLLLNVIYNLINLVTTYLFVKDFIYATCQHE